jgi:hypothetical protein
MRRVLAALFMLPLGWAHADEPTSQPADQPGASDQPPPVDTDTKVADLEQRLSDLEARLQNLEQRSVQTVYPTFKMHGYADLGFFAPMGNQGVGVLRDVGYKIFPEYSNYGWVFYGDLLATQVNSRGEVASLGNLPGVSRFDSVNDSNGAASFIVNEVNLTPSVGLAPNVLFSSSINFVPRSGHDFSLGDFIDVDIAQLEWEPFANGKTSVFVGKFDSVLGLEYKTRKSSQKFGITPSLIGRYTNGTAVGLKIRTKLMNDHLILAASLTNGSFGTEQFHFYTELDTNNFKTVSGRAALRTHIGKALLEVGGSGQAGTQDGAPDGAGMMWFAGADAELSTVSFDLKAEWLKAHAPGDETSGTYSLELNSGAFVELDWLLHHAFGIELRGEMRDATVAEGTDRIYVTKNWRAVAGVRWILSPYLVLKGEYLHNGEYGKVPNFDDDVLTSSLVVVY